MSSNIYNSNSNSYSYNYNYNNTQNLNLNSNLSSNSTASGNYNSNNSNNSNNANNNLFKYFTRSAKTKLINQQANCNFNIQEVPEYIAQIFKNLIIAERDFNYYSELKNYCNKYDNYFFNNIRFSIVDCISKQYEKYNLLQETFILSVNLFDRYLSLAKVIKDEKELYLVGITCLVIASKYEEIYAPEIIKLAKSFFYKFSKEDIIKMEIRIMNELKFEINTASSLRFMEVYLLLCRIEKKSKIYNLCLFLLDLSMLNFNVLLHKSSALAASIVSTVIDLFLNEDVFDSSNLGIRRKCIKNNSININNSSNKKSDSADDYSENTNNTSLISTDNEINVLKQQKIHLLNIFSDVHNNNYKYYKNLSSIEYSQSISKDVLDCYGLLKCSKYKAIENKYKKIDYNFVSMFENDIKKSRI